MSQLQTGQLYFGFELLKQEKIDEIKSISNLFIHRKTGARLLYFLNEDDNKAFSIGFRTPSLNSKGAAHILEHSVLCGSRKFPSKEPFVDLLKGSLHTFLNAMTYDDKTIYPLASRNHKDFANLMDVYLDAVFFPNIYVKPEIFMQEGWHYELEGKDAPIIYNGVVYNEMRGAMSSPESQVNALVNKILFPESSYRFNSGGEPEDIPHLSQLELEDFHRRYYHPSNSYIYLYGDLDILDRLKFIDEEYLGKFDSVSIDSEIKFQPPLGQLIEKSEKYSISATEKNEDKTYLSINFIGPKATDAETVLGFHILEKLLMENHASPLKKALLDSGIGKDFIGSYDDEMLQTKLSIQVQGANAEDGNRIKEIIFKTLNELVSNGIDKKLIESSINAKEFALRESMARWLPKGLIYGMACMRSWLYGEDPTIHLKYEGVIAKIREASQANYFESIIEKYILDSKHSCLVTLIPTSGLSEQLSEELRQKLDQRKSLLSNDDLLSLMQSTQRLKAIQQAEDSLESLAKIPTLSLSDIAPKPQELVVEKVSIEDATVLVHKTFTNKITYLNLYFDTRSVPEHQIPYLYLLSEIMGKMDTTKNRYEDFSREVNNHTGGIKYSVATYSNESNGEDKYYPKFLVQAKSLSTKTSQLFSILAEVLTSSVYDNRSKLLDHVREIKSKWEKNLLQHGHVFATKRLNSYFSEEGKYNDIGEIVFYQFLVKLESNFEVHCEDLISNLQSVSSLIFNKKNLIVSMACDDQDFSDVRNNFPTLFNSLGNQFIKPVAYQFTKKNISEGFVISSDVQYVVKGNNVKNFGHKYSGKLKVLQGILDLDYLWNRVRVQGGAYGGFAQFDRNGDMAFISFRDPNLKKTIATYEAAPDYLNNFDVNEREMVKYIIGTIGQLDWPLTPEMKCNQVGRNYISGISFDDLCKERQEVLSTTKEDIKGFSSLVSQAITENYLCVVGNGEVINSNSEVFNNIHTVVL